MIPKKNALEWTVFVVSLVLVVAVIGILIASATRGADEPPHFAVTTGDPVRKPTGYSIPVAVENLGDETAADLKVEVLLRNGTTIVERSEFTLAYVPRRSKREGAVLFHRDPRCCEVAARALGFEKP